MDAAQKLTCTKLRADDEDQSVLNVQERRGAPLSCDKKWIYPTTSWCFCALAPYFL